MTAPGEPSRVRQGLDRLLELHPHLDLVAIDWQIDHLGGLISGPLAERGPWVLVDLGQPSDRFDRVPAWALWRFAILKTTGNVYRLEPGGAVEDDPLITITPT